MWLYWKLQAVYLEGAEILGEFIIHRAVFWYLLQKFGVTDVEVRESLVAGDPHHQLKIAYYLIIDNKRMMSEG